ncbi:MAG: hypothetical protein ACD_22C00051G0002 [uncultured bacterium]|uniref:Uncharacterized protein n=1 Tax=candidate division WWE3 bacterium RBG_16_37_10 TaxID=1802610 RepID=A0A1F4UXJ9_UNCKA|nr:MAG: hypothetical protein ACD_22C00051G0002 [uncultured bacterium]OGC49658.1 MAG: hypothetical protein A2W32_04965 [candidate division WWE3 bacterium RBG_16_37_10]
MITKVKVDELVNFLNLEIKRKLEGKLDSAYIVGSYTQGKISLVRPDINWLLVHKNPIQDETRWELGEILTEAIDKFINDFVVRPELRPFKFSYPIKRGEDVFVNVSIVTNASSPDEFKHINNFIPGYVFEGFKSTRSLIFGEDTLKDIDFQVTKKSVHDDAVNKLVSHKIQLDRVPLVYHMKKDTDLIFNESLSHGKNLLYYGVELLMSDEELENKKYIDIFSNSDLIIDFYKNRLPDTLNYVKEIVSSKANFDAWKGNPKKARGLYLTVSAFSKLLFRII